MARNLVIGMLMLLTPLGTASAQYSDWQHSGSLYILTTSEGADLPSGASEKDFPLLVRLDKDFFDFTQARTNGEDIRFTTADGTPLAYQIEQWDSANGSGSIWVRIPKIQGNERQELKLFWGKADAESKSSGSAVFNAENGFASVVHMNEALKDELGAIAPEDQGTTSVGGIIGEGRHFTRGNGIHCGNYGLDRTKVLSAPNLRRAYFTSAAKNEITLKFDQPMVWKEECKAWIYLDGTAAAVSAGKVTGGAITLRLAAPSSAKAIAYLSGKTWDGRPDKLLYGANGIAALAFSAVPLSPETPTP